MPPAMPRNHEITAELLEKFKALSSYELNRLRGHKHAMPDGAPVAAKPDDTDTKLFGLGLLRQTTKRDPYSRATRRLVWMITTDGLEICRRTGAFWDRLAKRSA